MAHENAYRVFVVVLSPEDEARISHLMINGNLGVYPLSNKWGKVIQLDVEEHNSISFVLAYWIQTYDEKIDGSDALYERVKTLLEEGGQNYLALIVCPYSKTPYGSIWGVVGTYKKKDEPVVEYEEAPEEET